MSNEHNLDFDRHKRLGFPEIVYGASKTTGQLLSILAAFTARGEKTLVTKLQADKAEALLEQYPNASYEEDSGCFISNPEDLAPGRSGEIAILSAGTSDSGVVNEAYHSLRFNGIEAERINDVGIAGVHRLLDKVEHLKSFKVLIVAAGFEGALPTAVAGLLPQPIVAVPTSVGYGVSKDGRVALDCMLASCANGVSVVNIDNGYGAAMAAFRILNMIEKAK